MDTKPSEQRMRVLEQRQKAYAERIPNTCKLDAKVEVKLGGKTYILHYTNYAIKKILEDTKENLMTGFTVAQMSDPVIFGSVLFRGLEGEHPELTQETTDKLWSLRHYPYIREQVVTALDLFYPDLSDIPMPSEEEEPLAEVDPT